MSNLPPEIEKQISDQSNKLTESLKLDTPFNIGVVQGFEDGYTEGATEWAGKAQELVEALEAFILWQGSTLKNWPVMKQAYEAIAKYKEVTNG